MTRGAFRRAARAAVAIALAATSAAASLHAAPDVDPLDCTNIDAVPVRYDLDYQFAVQGLFDAHCTECHSGKAPPAGLDLSAGPSWFALVDEPSSQDAAFTRVIPNHPLQSLLYQKVNCDIPGVGHRMPFGSKPLGLEDQALIYDWIAAGAPLGTTDGLKRSGFEAR